MAEAWESQLRCGDFDRFSVVMEPGRQGSGGGGDVEVQARNALLAELDETARFDLAEQAVIDSDPVDHFKVAGCAADLDAGPHGRYDVGFHAVEGLGADEFQIGGLARVRSEENAWPGEERRVAGEPEPCIGRGVKEVSSNPAGGDELRSR